MDTAQLVNRCREGDSLAVEALVRTYKPLVYRLAVSILDDPAEADEATQDALVAALGKLHSFRGEAKFTTWLYTITLNVCRGRLRKRHARSRLLDRVWAVFGWQDVVAPQPEQTTLQEEQEGRLWQAVVALDERRRETIILRYYHELTLTEIGQVLGVSERTIRTWLHSAHEQMRTFLERD
ncbi:MAG: RNA polymerase sigma factor [Anaerolineae bacterium]|nr:RNA polymerase sigma factor [Anaerolineae bacterium]